MPRSQVLALLRALALPALVAAAVFVPSPVLAQGCVRTPIAVAGDDLAACIPPTGFSDFALTGFGSIARIENGPIVQYCWTTDFGTFVESGSDATCRTSPGVTLRAPHVFGHTIIGVRLVVTDAAGCTAEDALLVDLATSPVVTRAEVAASPVCFGTPVDVLANGVNTFDVGGLVTYSWDFDTSIDANLDGDVGNDGDQVVVGVSGRLAVASFTPVRIGDFTARLTATVAGSPCPTMIDLPYRVSQPPGVRLVVGPATTCVNETGTFQAELEFGDVGSDMTWDFDISVDSDGDGDPGNDVEGSGFRVSNVWGEAGLVTLRATAVGTNNCRGSEDRTIVVKPAPAPAFITSGLGCGSLAVTFIDRSVGIPPLAISWSYGDGSPAETGPTRTHIYQRPGSYDVIHTATDDDGCIVAESRRIDVVPTNAEIAGVTIWDGQPGTGSSGNANGFADPGERVRIAVDVANDGSTILDGLVAILTTPDLAGFVTITDGQAAIGQLLPGATGSTLEPHLEAQISGFTPCGSRIALEIRVATEAGSCPATLTVPLGVGAPGVALASSEFPVTNSPGRADQPDAVFGAGSHVVVVADATGSTPRILLARFDAAGNRVADDLRVNPSTQAAGSPQVAWAADVSRFAVTWTSHEQDGASQGASGARLQVLDGGAHLLGLPRRLDVTGYAGPADVAWAADHWLAAWGESPQAGEARALRLQALNPDGLFLGGAVSPGVDVDAGGAVRAASNGDRVLVAAPDRGRVRLLLVEGLPPAVTSSWTLEDAASPAVASFGAGFIVAVESDGGIETAWISPGGTISRARVTDAGSRPALATGGEIEVVAWEAGNDVVASVLGDTGTATGGLVVVTPGGDRAGQPTLSSSNEGLLLAAFTSLGVGANTLVRATVLGPSAASECFQGGVLGDVAPPPDGNGVLDIADVVLVLRAAVGLAAVTPEMLARGDVAPGVRAGATHRVAGDGVIDIADAVVLLQASVGLVTLTR